MIAVIDYGAGNIFSVKNALDYLGFDSLLTNKKEDIEKADGLILPGVGAFPSAMKMLEQSGLTETIKTESKKKPFLGICLGMQLIFQKGYEFEECDGLGLIPGSVRKMEEKGMYGFVGKVNMDCNSPEFLIETTEDSLRETEIYLDSHTGSGKVKPILAPRFAPTCSEKLMTGLGKLAAKYHCGVHTHLVESIWEAEEALRCFPGYHSDAEIYERAGLMDHGPSIFAHVIFPTEEDKRIMKKHGSFSVHCPDATTNIIAGIMPLAAMHDEELKIAIGSDVAGGHSIAIYKQIARAVQLSKLKEFYEPDQSQTITLTQAFYHATKEAGSVFGKVGSFEKGYQFNALVIDTMEDSWVPLTAEERLERFCYIGDDRNIRARFIDGEEIHFEN